MKIIVVLVALLSVSIFASCDVQSGITKKSVENFTGTPTPAPSPTPTEEPIDPADIVQVDTSVIGPSISVNTAQDKMNLVCDKYNRVLVNGSAKKVTVKGACSQIMLNGMGHEVAAEAVNEIVFNGTGNKVTYSRYANGKRPTIGGNKGSNTVETVAAAAAKK